MRDIQVRVSAFELLDPARKQQFYLFFTYWCMRYVMTARHVSRISRAFELPFILPFCIVFGFCSTHLGKHHFNIIWQLLFIFRTLNVSVSAFVLLCHRSNTCTQMCAYSETRTHFIVSALFFAVILMESGLQIMQSVRRCWRFSRKPQQEPRVLIHLPVPLPVSPWYAKMRWKSISLI